MMQRATQRDIPFILEYISKELPCCLYMYADIAVYGIDNPNLDLWFDRDEQGICRVVMRYHRAFQLYASRDFSNVSPILELIRQHRPYGISGRREMIEALAACMPADYETTYGVVFRGIPVCPPFVEQQLENCAVDIQPATVEDAEEIADLICMDADLGSVYTVASLSEELRERMTTGMGRSYVIRQDGKIVAHNATYAETDRFVITSGMIVHPDYRDMEYMNWLDQKSILEFTRGNKEYYFFANNKRLIRYFVLRGCEKIAEYGKLSRRDIRA